MKFSVIHPIITNFKVKSTMRLSKNAKIKSYWTIQCANIFVQLNLSCKIKHLRDSNIFTDNLFSNNFTIRTRGREFDFDKISCSARLKPDRTDPNLALNFVILISNQFC